MLFNLRLHAAPLLLALLAATASQEPQDDPPAGPPEGGATPEAERIRWVGRVAPELHATNWINLAPGAEPPTLENLRGGVVLLEFWSTVQKACGKGLPHAQRHHTRLAPYGLEVLALSYDPSDRLEQLVETYGITVRLGTDTSMADFREYQVPAVPYACVISPEGKILYHGTPELAEPVVLEALGLETEAGAVIESVARAGDAQALRNRLRWLIDSGPRSFDIAGFAAELLGESVPASEATELDPTAALDAWVDALASGAQGETELTALASCGAHEFDLRKWGWARLAEAAPIEREEFDALVDQREFRAAMDTLLFRAPSEALMQHAVSVPAFVEHCTTATREARGLAKKALLAELWYLSEVEPRSRNAYWLALGIGGDPDRDREQSQPTLVIGFERLDRAAAAAYFEEAMLRHLVSARLASGGVPSPDKLRARVPKERERLLRSATAKHGQPADH